MNSLQHRMGYRTGLVLIILWLFVGACHLPAQFWWLEDDPIFLQGIVRYGVLAHFYRPEVWQDLMPYHLMPWVILSFGIDWQFFGLNPVGYYWHHLFSFAGVMTIAFLLLRQFFSRWICATVLMVFILSQPTAYALQSDGITRQKQTRSHLKCHLDNYSDLADNSSIINPFSAQLPLSSPATISILHRISIFITISQPTLSSIHRLGCRRNLDYQRTESLEFGKPSIVPHPLLPLRPEKSH